MTMHDYVESLRGKHAHLEQQIDDELHRPLPDHSILTRLKREKLRIKDEIARLGRRIRHAMKGGCTDPEPIRRSRREAAEPRA